MPRFLLDNLDRCSNRPEVTAMPEIDSAQRASLAQLLVGTRPDWHPHAVHGAVSAAASGTRKHRPSLAELTVVIGLVLDDPTAELDDLRRPDSGYWARARRLLRTDEDGRLYASGAAMRTIRGQADARAQALDLNAQAEYSARVRAELMAARERRDAVLTG